MLAELVATFEAPEEVLCDDGLARGLAVGAEEEVCDDELAGGLFVGVEVEIVAPEGPSVRKSMFNWTWNLPIPESQQPFV